MLLIIALFLIISFEARSVYSFKNNTTRINDAESECNATCEENYSSSSDLSICKSTCADYDGECPGSYSDCVNELSRSNDINVGDMCEILCPSKAAKCNRTCETDYSNSDDILTCKHICNRYDGECPLSYSDCLDELAYRANNVLVRDMCDILCPGGQKIAIIVGIVIAVIVVIGLIIGAIVLCCIFCRRKKTTPTNNASLYPYPSSIPPPSGQYPMVNVQPQPYNPQYTPSPYPVPNPLPAQYSPEYAPGQYPMPNQQQQPYPPQSTASQYQPPNPQSQPYDPQCQPAPYPMSNQTPAGYNPQTPPYQSPANNASQNAKEVTQ